MIRFLPALVLVLGFPGQGLSAREDLPLWFWAPPGPEWTVVFSSSDEEAIWMASQRLVAYRESRIVGRSEQFLVDSLDQGTWKNTDYYYVYPDGADVELARTLVVWDRELISALTGQWVYLVGPPELPPGTGPVYRMRTLPAEQPLWAEELNQSWAKAGRVGAVGRFTLRGNPADAWSHAEELGFLELLNQQRMDLRQVVAHDKSSSGESNTNISVVLLNFEVHDLRVEGRWFDREHNDAVVAVSAPTGGIRVLRQP